MSASSARRHARSSEPIWRAGSAGGTGWKAQRWKQDILERASISIAKSNYEMLRCHCTAPYA